MYKITVPTVITNGHFNKEKTLSELKRCGAERVALAIERELDYCFSSDENLAILKECIEYFHENGLEVAVWIGETLGHSGDKPFPNLPYTNIRLFEKGDISAFCPKDELFIKNVAAWVKDVAALGPDVIMLDDDFRILCRGGMGCCCPLHMKALCKELGEEIGEEELYEKLWNGMGNKYRSAWLKVQGDSLREFAKRLRSELNTVSPKTRLGFCTVFSWDAEGWDPIEISKLMAGDTEPFLRISGAPYWTRDGVGQRLGEVVEMVRWQFDYFKDNGIELLAEGDTYPRPRFECPAALLECFDMINRADGNSDGILKYMLDYVSDADYETGYIDFMVKNREIYRDIEKHFAGKRALGVRPYVQAHTVEDAQIYRDSRLYAKTQDVMHQPSFNLTAYNALPVSYESDSVNIIFGENARYIPEHELKNGNIIDIVAAKILCERGIDVGIEDFAGDIGAQSTSFSGVPSEYFMSEDNYTRLGFGVTVAGIKHRDTVRFLSKFKVGNTFIGGVFEYENNDGIRFTVLPFDGYEAKCSSGWLYNYSRRRQLTHSIEWLSGKPLAAYIDGNYPDMYFMTKASDSSLSVGLWNLFADRADGVRVKISDEYKRVEFIGCRGHIENGYVILDSPVYPYEFAGFELYK